VALSSVELIAPDGSTVPVGPALLDTRGRQTIIVPISLEPADGPYTVRWRAASADGHPVRGSFTFTIAVGAIDSTSARPSAAEAAVGAETTGAPSTHTASKPGAEGPMQRAFEVQSPAYDAVRWVTFVALLGVIGAVSFVVLVAPRLARATARSRLAELAAAGSRSFGMGATVLLLSAAVARLVAQSYAVQGSTGALDLSETARILLHSRWGLGWMLQFVCALVLLVALGLARAGRRTAWQLAVAAILGLAASAAVSGHAAATTHFTALVVLSDVAHVLGAGGWLGTLLVVIAVALPAAVREGEGMRGRAAADVINAFSPVALACGGSVAVTGVVAAWAHLGALPTLWESEYGGLLLLKLGVLTAVVTIGAYNWRIVRPSLRDERGARRVRRSAAAELSVGALLLAVTAVLVVTPPPEEDHSPPAQHAAMAR
jgi:putative copper export protein